MAGGLLQAAGRRHVRALTLQKRRFAGRRQVATEERRAAAMCEPPSPRLCDHWTVRCRFVRATACVPASVTGGWYLGQRSSHAPLRELAASHSYPLVCRLSGKGGLMMCGLGSHKTCVPPVPAAGGTVPHSAALYLGTPHGALQRTWVIAVPPIIGLTGRPV